MQSLLRCDFEERHRDSGEPSHGQGLSRDLPVKRCGWHRHLTGTLIMRNKPNNGVPCKKE